MRDISTAPPPIAICIDRYRFLKLLRDTVSRMLNKQTSNLKTALSLTLEEFLRAYEGEEVVQQDFIHAYEFVLLSIEKDSKGCISPGQLAMQKAKKEDMGYIISPLSWRKYLRQLVLRKDIEYARTLMGRHHYTSPVLWDLGDEYRLSPGG